MVYYGLAFTFSRYALDMAPTVAKLRLKYNFIMMQHRVKFERNPLANKAATEKQTFWSSVVPIDCRFREHILALRARHCTDAAMLRQHCSFMMMQHRLKLEQNPLVNKAATDKAHVHTVSYGLVFTFSRYALDTSPIAAKPRQHCSFILCIHTKWYLSKIRW